MPVNAVIIGALSSLYLYYGDNFKVGGPIRCGLTDVLNAISWLDAGWGHRDMMDC